MESESELIERVSHAINRDMLDGCSICTGGTVTVISKGNVYGEVEVKTGKSCYEIRDYYHIRRYRHQVYAYCVNGRTVSQ